MKKYNYIFLLWQFNMLLDTGKYTYVGVAEIKRQIRTGAISTYLKNTFPDADFSLIEPQDWDHLSNEWISFADDIDERRKMGIINNGVCLLLAYTLNALQTHLDEK